MTITLIQLTTIAMLIFWLGYSFGWRSHTSDYTFVQKYEEVFIPITTVLMVITIGLSFISIYQLF